MLPGAACVHMIQHFQQCICRAEKEECYSNIISYSEIEERSDLTDIEDNITISILCRTLGDDIKMVQIF